MQKNSISYRKKTNISSEVIMWAVFCLIIAFAVVRVFFAVNYFSVYVIGPSMEGTLNGAENKDRAGGDYVYAMRSSSPDRGDIVIIKIDGDEPIIKRVIALGGDTVELVSGVLYRNGVEVSEPYVDPKNNTPSDNNFELTTVPEGYMFFLGDNRDVSVDSRSGKYGMLPVDKTMGVVADWSLTMKGTVTAFNTFFDFTLGLRTDSKFTGELQNACGSNGSR